MRLLTLMLIPYTEKLAERVPDIARSDRVVMVVQAAFSRPVLTSDARTLLGEPQEVNDVPDQYQWTYYAKGNRSYMSLTGQDRVRGFNSM